MNEQRRESEQTHFKAASVAAIGRPRIRGWCSLALTLSLITALPVARTVAGAQADAPRDQQSAAEPSEAATAADAQAPAEEAVAPLLIQPPLFSKWIVKARYDDAASLASAAGYDVARVNDAIRAYRTLLELYPGNPYADQAAWQICSLTNRLRDPPKAMAAYAAYIAQFPDGDNAVTALWSLISHLSRARDYPSMLDRYSQLVKAYPNSYYVDDALWSAASRLNSEGDHAEAVDAYTSLLKRCPDSDYCDDALSQIASILSRYGQDPEGAVAAYRDLLAKYPYSDRVDDSLYGILNCYVQTQQIGKAIELYNAFVGMFPSSSYLRYMRSRLRYYTRRYPGVLADDPNEDWARPLYRQVADLYNHAYALRYVKKYADAAAAYQALLAQFPDSDYTDDAVLALGQCYEELHKYRDRAQNAATPEEIAQVEQDWAYVVGQHTEIDAASQLADAVSAYVWLANNCPGSDLRDDALYRAAGCYGAQGDKIGELVCHLQLIENFPHSGYAPTSLNRIHSLKNSLKSDADKVRVYNAVINAYPEHAYADDYLFELGQLQLERGDVRRARATFETYVRMYPHRAYAADAAFLFARCRDILLEPQLARQAYARVVTAYPSSGLADDAFLRAQRANSEQMLTADWRECKRIGAEVEKALKRSIEGYDVILRPHVAVIVPFRHSTRIRAYNLPDRFEDAYGLLQHWTGVQPTAGERLSIVLDPDFKGLKAGDPVQVGLNYCGEPPLWLHCFQPIAERFTTAQPIAPATQAVPGLANGLARLAALQLNHGLFQSIGPTELGSQTATQHLSQIVAAKQGARDALTRHIQAKEPASKANGTIALGMLLNVLEAGQTADEVIDWTPLQPFFQVLASVSPQAKKLETPEERAALVAICMDRAMGAQSAKGLEALGLDIPQDVMQRVQAIIEGREPPPEKKDNQEAPARPAGTAGKAETQNKAQPPSKPNASASK
ncbi:MAG: tol-pal system YbgF family protein [Armatimonadota bacterium]